MTWEALQITFLEKFFRASHIGSIRKEICGIRQHYSESLYEYWERFKSLCASIYLCPQHQISDQLLIQYIYEGLLPNDKGMIDAASGGALVDKTPTQAKELISNMAQNTQRHSARNDVKRVNEIDLSGVKSQLQENAQQIATSTTLMSKHVGNASRDRVCGICSDLSHTTDFCPTLKTKDVNALGGSSVNILPYDIYMMYEFDSLQSTNHTLPMADNTEVKIVRVLNNALIRDKNIFFLDDFYIIDTKHEFTILLGRPFLKTSIVLINMDNGSVVLESNGEKIEFNMIDKVLIPEANAIDYVANYLEQIGVDNLKTILDGIVAEMG
ncbi:Oligoribonuclease [Bienertia sinuspersici]